MDFLHLWRYSYNFPHLCFYTIYYIVWYFNFEPTLHFENKKKKKKNTCKQNNLVLITKLCPTIETACTGACQTPMSIGFSRQEYWSRVAISFSRVFSQPRDRTQVSCTAGRFFTNWATREDLDIYQYPFYRLLDLAF